MDHIERYFECNAPGVIFERFEDETVVINLDSGHYYTLDTLGAIIWERLDGCVALGQVITDVKRDYEGEPAAIEEAVREFVGLLLAEQLMRPVASPDPAKAAAGAAAPDAAPAAKAKPAFRAPQLGKYNDMAEMLLLDPVHDVDGAGWPSAPATRANQTVVVEDDVSEWPDLKSGR